MNRKEIEQRRSRILAKESFINSFPEAYKRPGRPFRNQEPFFEQAVKALAEHHFRKRYRKPAATIPLSIVFEGPTGCGKTHLAALLALFGADRASMIPTFLSCQTMASDLSFVADTNRRRREPADIMEQVEGADLVVLDDLGTQDGLAKHVTKEVIDLCSREQKLLVGTTNNTDDDLIPLIGERGLSRLKQGTWIRLPLAIPDFREGVST